VNFRFENVDSLRSYSDKCSPFEHQWMGDIIKEYPETSEVMKKYFGEECLKRAGSKIKTIEIACILFGVDQNLIIQGFEKIREDHKLISIQPLHGIPEHFNG
jgi:hypothetical protein